MIESRKRADNNYKQMDAVIADNKRILQIANFENLSTLKIEFLSRNKDQQGVRDREEEGVNLRRQRLADLYNYEIEMWRGEAMSLVETQEDRKER